MPPSEPAAAGEPAGNRSEAYFLLAVSKRFRMGELNIGQTSDAYAQAQRFFEAASDALTKHQSHAADGHLAERQRAFFEIRANSERAAANLFLAEIAWATATRTEGTGRSKQIYEDAKATLLRAGELLSQCLRLQQAASTNRLRLDSEDAAHRLIKVQILVNIAAYTALGNLIFGSDDSFRRPGLEAELDNQVEALLAFMGDKTEPLFREEIAVFRRLRGTPGPISFARSHGDRSLAIDARLSRALQARWSEGGQL